MGLWRGHHDANPRMGLSPQPRWRSAQPAPRGAARCQAHSNSDRPQLAGQGQTSDMAVKDRVMVANPVATAELQRNYLMKTKPMQRSESPLRGETIGSDRSPLRPCREWSRSARVMASDPAAQRARASSKTRRCLFAAEDPGVVERDHVPMSAGQPFPYSNFLGCHFWGFWSPPKGRLVKPSRKPHRNEL